jgi:hypothetical protein
VFIVLLVLIGVSFFLGILGVVIEYTYIGHVKLNHEETNFSNIDIPIIQNNEAGGSWEQLS